MPSGLLVVNRDDPVALGPRRHAPAPVVRFGTGLPAPGDYGVVGSDLVGPPGVLAAVPASGAPHDIANALAAAAAALAVGADIDAVARALDGFGGLAHRVQLVAERGGVRWYDDSKATNPHATAGALAGFEHVVLIAGGRNKGLDLGGLRVHAPQLRAVVAIGEAAGEVEAAFAGAVPGRARRLDARGGARRGRHTRSPATPCSCRPRARRSTGTRAMPRVVTTSRAR